MNNEILEPKKYILWGIPILFFVGSFFHFIYEWSGNCALIAVIAPINESVFEHLKLVFVPFVLWWSLYYIFKGDRYGVDINRWFTSMLLGLVVSMLLIPMFFYFYTGILGVNHIIFVDITIFLIALALGSFVARHYYIYGKGINWKIAIAITVILFFIFVYLTFSPPNIPFFISF